MEDEFEEYETDQCIGYYCLACGHTQEDNDWGGECERCMGHSLEEINYE